MAAPARSVRARGPRDGSRAPARAGCAVALLTRRALTGALLGLALLPAAGHAALPQGNLIVNPGAESGPGAADARSIVALPGWVSMGSFTALRYGTAGFPSAAHAAAISGGQSFFAGGPDNVNAAAHQVINVAGAAAEIDAGQVIAKLSAQLGGLGQDADEMSVTAVFLSAGSAQLGVLRLDPISEVERGGETRFVLASEEADVPAGTRSIGVLMSAAWHESPYNDAYADNLELTLERDAPQLGRSVGASVVRGRVYVQLAGSGSARASQRRGRFVPLRAGRQIPVGSLLNTRRGTVRLTSAVNTRGRVQSGQFSSGIFQVLQSRRRRARGLTELRLRGSSFRRCGRASRADVGAEIARARRIRRLRGNARGRFRTRGRYSSATVRGTVWTTTDRCDGTLTKVTRGRVAVRDLRRRRTIQLRAGRSYLARRR